MSDNSSYYDSKTEPVCDWRLQMFMVKEDMDCMTEAYERIQEEYSTTQREQENTQVGLLNILSEVKVTMKGQSQMLPCPQLLLPQYSRYMYLTEVIQSHFLFVFCFKIFYWQI